MEGESNLVAYFEAEPTSYNVSVSANPSNAGSVFIGETPPGTTSGNYASGTVIRLNALANTGYTFANWKLGNDVVSTDASFNFTVEGESNLVAYFEAEPTTYNVSVSANPSNAGEPYIGDTPGTTHATFTHGQSCTVHANPSTGYIFTNWTVNGSQVSTSAVYTFTVTSSLNLVANYTQQHTVTVSAYPTSGGSVNIGNIPGTTQSTFTHGQSCTVHAVPNNGYSFSKWMENGNEVPNASANYTFNVTSNRNLVAHFSQNTYNISLSADPTEGGTVTGNGAFHYGEPCTVLATPNQNFSFTNWMENDSVVSTQASYRFTVTSNRNLVAHFTAQVPNTYTVTVEANPTNGGAPYIGNTPDTTQAFFNSGQSCTVHANPANGYSFVKWTENETQVSTNANYTFTVTTSRNLVAHYQTQQQTYTVTVSAYPANGGAPYIGNIPGTTQSTFTSGQSCTVHANHHQGYVFQNWTMNGAQVSPYANYTFTVTSNRNLVAHFTQEAPTEYTITATAYPANGGTVTGSGTYQQGNSCTLTATPNTNSGYEFVNWTKNEQQVSTNPTYSFPVTESAAYVANFSLKSFTISASAVPSNGGTVSGSGTYEYGTDVNLQATANEGYIFTRWQDGNTDNPRTITVTENANYKAYFEKPKYTITVSAHPDNGGSAYIGDTPDTMQATYDFNEPCTVHARAKVGFKFFNWTESDEQVSTRADYTFTVTSDRNLVANFIEEDACTINVDIVPEEGGTVTGAGVYTPGDSCTLKAKPRPGYLFIKWTRDDVVVSTDPSHTFTVTETEYYVAHFDMKKYTITATSVPSVGGTISGDGQYLHGAYCELEASPNPGFIFKNWMNSDNIVVTTDTQYRFQVTSDASYTANFKPITIQPYTVSVMANPTIGGAAYIGDSIGTTESTFNEGQTCTVHAAPETGYTFTNWTENGTAVSSNSTYEFTVTADRNLIANFEKDENPCIDLQKIEPKEHTEDNATYILILVYPNPHNENYTYQWFFSDEENGEYTKMVGVTGQYYYKKGGILEGYYKVQITKGECSETTEPYHVQYNHHHRLRIYPNPSRRDHNIMVVNDSNGPSQLSIYSTDGRPLHAQTVTDNQTTLNLNLPSGVYIVYLTDSDGYTKIGKLVIQ